MRPSRAQLTAIVLLLAFSLISGLRTLQQVATANPNALVSSQVPVYEQQVQLLKPYLPQRGYVGYMSDAQSSASVYFREYYGIQYALAPLMFLVVGDVPPDIPYILSRDMAQRAPPDIIVASFHNRSDLEAQIKAMNLRIVAQSGDTLFVLQKVSSSQRLNQHRSTL